MSVPARKQLAPRSPKWSEVEEKVAAVLFRKPYEVYGWLYKQRERFKWQVPDEVIFARILERKG